jgi:hypothetical protein
MNLAHPRNRSEAQQRRLVALGLQHTLGGPA